MDAQQLRQLIRDVPNFPKEGIVFKDIAPLLAAPGAIRGCAELLNEAVVGWRGDALIGIESRGFLFAAAMSAISGAPVQIARKPGKLPYETIGIDYDLEYGSDRIEMHVDAIQPGARYVIIDDLIATGGTAAATASLVREHGGVVVGACFVIGLTQLAGADSLGCPTHSLIEY